MRIIALLSAILISGCAAQTYTQTEQLGRVQSLQLAENPHTAKGPSPIADAILRDFDKRFGDLCDTPVTELREYNEDYDQLYAPEVALLPRSVYRQQGERPAYVLTQHMFEVVKLYPDDEFTPEYWIVGVPKGFVFDGHSLRTWIYFIPGAAVFLNPVRNEINSSLVHDWLYALGPARGGPNDCENYKYSGCRAFADDAYQALLDKYQVDQSAMGVAHWAVKQGGGRAFGRWEELRFYDKDRINPVEPEKVQPEKEDTSTKQNSQNDQQEPDKRKNDCHPDDRGRSACPVQPIILEKDDANAELRLNLRKRTVCKVGMRDAHSPD